MNSTTPAISRSAAKPGSWRDNATASPRHRRVGKGHAVETIAIRDLSFHDGAVQALKAIDPLFVAPANKHTQDYLTGRLG